VQTMGVELRSKLTEFDDKYHLLNKNDYDTAKTEIVALIKASTAR
jgi:hypothetical protein